MSVCEAGSYPNMTAALSDLNVHWFGEDGYQFPNKRKVAVETKIETRIESKTSPDTSTKSASPADM